jgi:hypothetical protein
MDWEAEAADPNPAAGEDEEMDEANGNEEDEEEMNVDDMPVTQEDAWAVIRCVRISNEPNDTNVHLVK